MKRVLALLLAAGLCGCASSSGGVSLEDGLQSLIGKDAREATALFGNPGTMHPTGREIVYIWKAKQSALAPTPGSNAQNEAGAKLAAQIQSDPGAAKPPPSCTLKMTVDAAGRIKSYQLSGHVERCGSFARAFSPQS